MRWCLLATLSFLTVSGDSVADPSEETTEVVSTSTGPIQGTIVKFEDKRVERFLGIPYAETPVGDRRFRKPVAIQPWKDLRPTQKFSKACVQATYVHGQNVSIGYDDASEDCLTINVWKPMGGQSKKSIVVFLYGGAFQFGDSSLFYNDGLPFAALNDVIFVSFNYRVGVFGFLSTRHEDAPGNVGFYDQLLALKWVKENAQNFNGNPDSITLYGQSSGAFSVGLHMYSPLSKGLFKRVILESGTALSLITFQMKNEISRFHTLIGLTNCTSGVYSEEKYKTTMDCIRKADAHTIINGVANLGHLADMYLPIYDDEFVPIHPLMPEEVKVLNGEEVFLGTTTDEGTLFINFPLQNLLAQGDVARTQFKIVPSSIYPRLFDTPWGAIYHNFDQYFENALDAYADEDAYNLIGQTYGDAVFTCPTNLFGEVLAKRKHSVYRYQFTHRPSLKLWPNWMGVVHNTDLPYFLGTILLHEKNLEDQRYAATPEWFRKHKFTEAEILFSKQLVKMLGDFVKTGKPTVPNSPNDEWPLYSPKSEKYINLAPNNFTVSSDGPKKDKCELWRPYLIRRKGDDRTTTTTTTKKPLSFGPIKKAPPKPTKTTKSSKVTNYRKRLEGKLRNDSNAPFRQSVVFVIFSMTFVSLISRKV